MVGRIPHMCISAFARANWTLSLCRILPTFLNCAMFVMSSQVAAHTTTTCASEHVVRNFRLYWALGIAASDGS